MKPHIQGGSLERSNGTNRAKVHDQDKKTAQKKRTSENTFPHELNRSPDRQFGRRIAEQRENKKRVVTVDERLGEALHTCERAGQKPGDIPDRRRGKGSGGLEGIRRKKRKKDQKTPNAAHHAWEIKGVKH